MKSCISLIFDEKLVVPAAVLIQSISDNYHDNQELDIVCCIPGESKAPFNQVLSMVDVPKKINIKLVSLTVKMFPWLSILNKTSSDHWAPPIERYKLFLGSFLSGYDKTIYLDTDTMVVKNIQPVLDHPMHNKFMAVPDVTGTEFQFLKSRGELSYLNNGVMIIDLEWWRSEKIEKTILDHLHKEQHVRVGSEELSNVYLKKYWHPLPFTFNFYAFSKDKYKNLNYDESSFLPEHYKHAIIFHFAGQAKPWNYEETLAKKDKSLLGEKWRRMAKVARDRLDIKIP